MRKTVLYKLISLCIAAVMIAGALSGTSITASAYQTETELHHLAFASDMHGNDSYVSEAMKDFPQDTEYVSLIGDLVGDGGGDAPAYNSSTIYGLIQGVFKNIAVSGTSIVWADHDANVEDDIGIVKGYDKDNPGYQSGQVFEGKNKDGSTAYLIYVVGFYHMLNGGSVSKEAAAAFKSWVDGIDTSIPIIVLCHAPLVAKRGDNYGATYWNEALNYAATGVEGITTVEKTGEVIRNVIYLYGHNHTVDATEYCYQPGSVMTVQIDASGKKNSGMLFMSAASSDADSPFDFDEEDIVVIESDNDEEFDGDYTPVFASAGNVSVSEEDADDESAEVLLMASPAKSGGKRGGKTKAEGVPSNVYYTAMIPGYLKTSQNATLLTIASDTITLTKYHDGEEQSIGKDAETGNDLGSTVTISRVVSAAPAPAPSPSSKGEAEKPVYVHEHAYSWSVTQEATETSDGLMAYQCDCGDVMYSVPLTGYYVFNKNAAEKIQNAPVNATVNVETPVYISFHKMVFDALENRPDVTVNVTYQNSGKWYSFTIPAGYDVSSLPNEEGYAGFLYLGQFFETTER